MKKKFLALFFILLSFRCFAENIEIEKSVKTYQLENSLLGFGIGSFAQGDSKSGFLLAAMDLTGITMIAGGLISYSVCSYFYEGYVGYAGEVTTADLWVSAGVAVAGLGTFLAGRILGWNIPTRFESKKNNVALNAFVAPISGGVSAGFKLEL